MSVADDFRVAAKLIAAVPDGTSARSVGVPQDAPNYSAKSLSGASFDSGSSEQQSGLSSLGSFSQGLNGLASTIGSIFGG